jgi:predicted RNA-binding Zn-ribbon protein involved in translation (DUF1610 family)
LIVITSEASPYEPQLRLKCHNEIEKAADTRTQKCGNLFTQHKCPICGWIPRGLGRIRCVGIVQITKLDGIPIDCGTGGRLATHNGEKYVQWQEGSDRIKLQEGDTTKQCRCLHDKPRCPDCGLSRQLRPVQVWVRTGAMRAPYDPERYVGQSPDDD